MKARLLILAIFLVAFVAPKGFAQEADKVLGYWLTQYKDSQVKIFKASNGKYYGEVRWLENPNEEDGTPKLDDENEDESLRNKPILGLQILKDFEYNADDQEWNEGTIYDPKNGKKYSCYMWFEEGDNNTLHVKGYIGFSLLGREVAWTREDKLRE